MKILHFSASDGSGGAGVAARRLHYALTEIGINSLLVVQKKTTDLPTVHTHFDRFKQLLSLVRPWMEQKLYLTLKGYTAISIFSSFKFSSGLVKKYIKKFNPDLIHLHWINAGFMNGSDFKYIKKQGIPVVWTMHDSWPFTGGCHIPGKCNFFTSGCGTCQVLKSSTKNDLSREIYNKKKKLYKDMSLYLIAPSEWIAKNAENSKLFNNANISIIPNGININKMKGCPKKVARNLLNLSSDDKIILFGAPAATKDRNKGWDLLLSALTITSTWDKILVFGSGDSDIEIDPKIYTKIHFLGSFYDELSLSIIYSAADAMLVPSRQESFGLTALEALSCGTPVVAFNATGLKDIVVHKNCGYLAEPYSVQDFANGIDWILSQKADDISQKAVKRVESVFSIDIVVNQHINLYKKILTKQG